MALRAGGREGGREGREEGKEREGISCAGRKDAAGSGYGGAFLFLSFFLSFFFFWL